jgi:hypothetical protein
MRLFSIIALMLIVGGQVIATNGPQEPVGARPAGMGQAFVGVADDVNAIYWNPAGMSFLNHHEITFMHTDLFGLGIKNTYAAYSFPISGRVAVGFDWFNLGFSDFELGYNFNKLNFGAAYRVTSRLSIGGVLKYLNTSTEFDGRALGKGNGWTGDAGAFYRFSEKLSAGVALHNIPDATVRYNSGTVAQFYDLQTTVGVGYRLKSNLLLSLDIDQRARLGAEYAYGGNLLLRSGLQRELSGAEETLLSLGCGLKYGPLQFDYAYLQHPLLDATNMFSLTFSFNFAYAPISLKQVRILEKQGLFPSLWKNYASAPFLEFEVENRSDKPLSCSWELDLDRLLSPPPAGEVVLRPKETQKIRVSGSFTSGFYTNHADGFRNGKIKIRYARGKTDKVVAFPFQAFVYKCSAVDWNVDKRWVASFIDPLDPAIRSIAERAVEASASANLGMGTVSISSAAAIYELIRYGGMQYLPDANRPYGGSTGIDDIQFPGELLRTHQGDCDDLTALMCSLLESIGIETAVLDVPGHLFMMFDANVPETYRITLMVDDDMLVAHRGKIFIPLEVTDLANGFLHAWKQGATAYRRWDALNELNVINVHDAWSLFSPVPRTSDVSESSYDALLAMPQIIRAFEDIRSLQEEYLSRYTVAIERLSNNPQHLSNQAVAAALNNDLAAAQRLLERACLIAPTNDSLRMNLAIVIALSGDNSRASQMCAQIENATAQWQSMQYNHIIIASLATTLEDSAKRDSLFSMIDSYFANVPPTTDSSVIRTGVSACAKDERLVGEALAECLAVTLSHPITDAQMLKGDLQADKGKGNARWFAWYVTRQ